MITIPEEFKQYVVPRDGKKNLRFQGKEIACASSYSRHGDRQNRFNTLTAHETKGGKFVLHDEYTTCWQGENCTSHATVHESIEDLMDEAMGSEEWIDENGEAHVSDLVKELADELNFDLDEEIE